MKIRKRHNLRAHAQRHRARQNNWQSFFVSLTSQVIAVFMQRKKKLNISQINQCTTRCVISTYPGQVIFSFTEMSKGRKYFRNQSDRLLWTKSPNKSTFNRQSSIYMQHIHTIYAFNIYIQYVHCIYTQIHNLIKCKFMLV